MNAKIEGTEIAPVPGQAVIEYNITEAVLTALREKYGSIKAVTESNYETVKTGCKAMVSLRTGIETQRNKYLVDARTYTDDVNNEAKRCTGQVSEIEGPLKKLKTEYDEKQKAAIEKAERKEKNRTDAINNLIDLIESLGQDLDDMTSEELTKRLGDLDSMELSIDIYHEFLAVAKERHESSVARVTARRYKRIEFEQVELRQKETAKLLAKDAAEALTKRQADQAEIDRQKKELAKKEREFEEKQDARAKELAEEAAQRQADKDKEEAERKAEVEATAQHKRDEEIAKEAAQAALDQQAVDDEDARVAAEEAAELAPDKVKLDKYAERILACAEDAPELGHDKARKILGRSVVSLIEIAQNLAATAGKL